MLIHSKIDYTEYSEDASPISKDVNIKISHKKLVSQKQNALARAEWGKKNPDKVKEIAIKAGELSKNDDRRQICSEVGKKYGPENAVKYIPIETKKRNGKKFGKKNLVDEIICEKCGRITNKGNYRFHGNNCKEFIKIKLLDLLPDKFTQQIIKKVAEEFDIQNWKTLNLIHHSCPYTKCIIKVDRPNQFNPCWYGKNIEEINKVKKYLNV